MPGNYYEGAAEFNASECDRAPGEYTGGRSGPFAGRGPRGYRRADERIREEINEYLTWHWQIDAGQIQVSVDDGEVTLSGTVRARDEKRLVENLAETCLGVKAVRNKLLVDQKVKDVGEPFQ